MKIIRLIELRVRKREQIQYANADDKMLGKAFFTPLPTEMDRTVIVEIAREDYFNCPIKFGKIEIGQMVSAVRIPGDKSLLYQGTAVFNGKHFRKLKNMAEKLTVTAQRI